MCNPLSLVVDAQLICSSCNSPSHFHPPLPPPSEDEIYRRCLQSLGCPDPAKVRTRLKKSKDRLLKDTVAWVFQNAQYRSWEEGDDTCLLWIKGGAGKGKTMMSIGLVDRLLEKQNASADASVVVTYFFCQNADYELNTTNAIVKGLIQQLFKQRKELGRLLQDLLWDENSRSTKGNKSQDLCGLFLEMVEQCKCRRLYVIVDALDECKDHGMTDFLELVVKMGLGQPSKVKWLFTSRPLEAARRILLTGREQVQVSLELESANVTQAVEMYVRQKVEELDRVHSYGSTLRRDLEIELIKRAEGTFLWVSLVCQQLKDKSADETLSAVQDVLPGLSSVYARAFEELGRGDAHVSQRCMRLLRVMMLAYRPLKVAEVESLAGSGYQDVLAYDTIERCAFFVKISDDSIEFVHQSARDYLDGQGEKSPLEQRDEYQHASMALCALNFLNRRLKINLLDLPRPDSTYVPGGATKDTERSKLLDTLEYAATFWAEHLCYAERGAPDGFTIVGEAAVDAFLSEKLLEWLECLSLLQRLTAALEALKRVKAITDTPNVRQNACRTNSNSEAYRLYRYQRKVTFRCLCRMR